MVSNYIYVIYTRKWAKTLTDSGCENHYKGSQYGTDGKVSYIETIPHTVATPANRLLGWLKIMAELSYFSQTQEQ